MLMPMNLTDAYHTFWEKLLPAYTISKGEMRLPIVTSLQSLPNYNQALVEEELLKILQNLLDKEGGESAAKARMAANGENHLLPLIDSDYTGVVRFDCIWDEKNQTVKILEINCDYPDGLLLHDATYSALNNEPCNKHHSLYKQLFTPNESVHILYSKKAVFLDGYFAEFETLKELGTEVTIGADENEIRDNQTIKRCLETTKITTENAEILARTKHRFINSFALRTLGYKNLLTTIAHPYIPETKQINVETLTECLSRQANLVIKPADGCEGFGVYFGKDFSSSDWEILINSIFNKNYIMQELVEIPKMNVSLYENNTVVDKELYYDLCPHFFIKSGKVIGSGHTLMRFSENKIVNVSQGGGIGYHKL